MKDVVFLPATAPRDITYGSIPCELPAGYHAQCRNVEFDRLVWYNAEIRKQAITQIEKIAKPGALLVGFSKSGLGAINIGCAMPDFFSHIIVFDAPLMRRQLPPWGTQQFYRSDSQWQRDLPARKIRRISQCSWKLILISGESFGNEMREFSLLLNSFDCDHDFIASPKRAHNWNSGWIEPGLERVWKLEIGD
jgi:hypothetical protein